MELRNEKLLLRFKNTHGALFSSALHTLNADTLTGFEIAGNDQVFYPAFAQIVPDVQSGIANIIHVSSPLVPLPEAVRYAFKTYSVGNVRNACNLPLIPFRTDAYEEY
jgi:hypothetical protein